MTAAIQRVRDNDWSVAADVTPADGPALLPLLAGPDPQVRELAVTCLSKAGGAPARQGLLTALRDPVETVRGTAAALLRDHFTAEDIPAIQRELTASPDDNVRTQLALLLGMSGDPSPVPFLRERLEKERYGPARQAALLALARLKDPAAQEQVVAALQQDDELARVKVLESLLYVNDRRLLPKIVPVLGDTRQGSNIGSAHLPYYIRVCDVAINVAYELLGGNYAQRRHAKPYSEWERQQAHEAILSEIR